MGLNDTPSSERVHIGIFGKRNAGKSSIINAITGQEYAIVSEVKGTTTDPVYKSMELLPLGPVMMIDTPGLDDEGELGELRIRKSFQVLNKTDIAVIVVDATSDISEVEQKLMDLCAKKKIPYIIVYNKADLLTTQELSKRSSRQERSIFVSAKSGDQIHQLKELIAHCVPTQDMTLRLVGDLLEPSDLVVLVVPIDSAAPKGRLILPQQQTIRDVLEADATAVVVKETQLADTLSKLAVKPKMVITDSQAFEQVAKDTPDDVLLTSFSILFARYKGNLAQLANGAAAIDSLKDGDTILISEGCTHHRQCDDIGTVKLPRWLKEYTKKELNFAFTSGAVFADDLSKYALVIHCGGCMLNEREVKYRIACAADQNVPITNYGTAIAYMKGILKRSLKPFGICLDSEQ